MMDEDPGVKAGIFTYELHECRDFSAQAEVCDPATCVPNEVEEETGVADLLGAFDESINRYCFSFDIS